jgi:hypothetical protein
VYERDRGERGGMRIKFTEIRGVLKGGGVIKRADPEGNRVEVELCKTPRS